LLDSFVLAMIRRLSALVGIAALLAMLAALIVTVYQHRRNTGMADDPDKLITQPL